MSGSTGFYEITFSVTFMVLKYSENQVSDHLSSAANWLIPRKQAGQGDPFVGRFKELLLCIVALLSSARGGGVAAVECEGD